MKQPIYTMETRRNVVLRSMVERCVDRKWTLRCAHVRTNHVHLVIQGEAKPERMMNDLKASAIRYLNQLGLDEPDRNRWARHGSTRYLSSEKKISAALHYVIEKQGFLISFYPQTEP